MVYKKKFKSFQKACEALAIKDFNKFAELFGISEDFANDDFLYNVSIKESVGKETDKFFPCKVTIKLTKVTNGE